MIEVLKSIFWTIVWLIVACVVYAVLALYWKGVLAVIAIAGFFFLIHIERLHFKDKRERAQQ